MSEPQQPAVRYRFVGEAGTYLSGVPARDLTDDDLALLSDEQKAALEATGLYQPAGADAAPPPAEKEA